MPRTKKAGRTKQALRKLQQQSGKASYPYGKRPEKKNQQQKGPSGNKKQSQPQKQARQDIKPAGRLKPQIKAAHHVLLVGEGDFSFALSLLKHHACRYITATTIDTREALLEKHPQAAEHIRQLEEEYAEGSANLGEGKVAEEPSPANGDAGEVTTTLPPPVDEKRSDTETETKRRRRKGRITVLYGIDATKLGAPYTPHAAALRRAAPFDRVVFNFPHVGGKTTDVNRQVRLNQELVVKFLACAQPLLRDGSKRGRDGEGGDTMTATSKRRSRDGRFGPGQIMLTVFEGMPYELWGVRNLARHVGLRVLESFRFQPALFPGYRHARTLGNIEGDGGWKGEDRDARTYMFVKGSAIEEVQKKKKSGSDSEDEEDSTESSDDSQDEDDEESNSESD